MRLGQLIWTYKRILHTKCQGLKSSVLQTDPTHSNQVLKLDLNFHSYSTFNHLSWLKIALYRNKDLVIIHANPISSQTKTFILITPFLNQKTFKKGTTKNKTIYDFIRHRVKSLRNALIGNKLKQKVLRTSIRFLLKPKTFTFCNNNFFNQKSIMRLDLYTLILTQTLNQTAIFRKSKY